VRHWAGLRAVRRGILTPSRAEYRPHPIERSALHINGLRIVRGVNLESRSQNRMNGRNRYDFNVMRSFSAG
jgi:hypothetical protein